jgi:hypothetical protein
MAAKDNRTKQLLLKFDKDFFSKESADYSNSTRYIDPTLIDKFTDCIGKTFSKLQEARQKSSGDSIFGNNADWEIGRADSYRFMEGLPEEITIPAFKQGLAAKGIEDLDRQNLIIRLVLQNEVGMPCVPGHILCFLLKDLAFDEKELCGLYISSGKKQTLLECGPSGEVILSIKVPIVYRSENSKTEIGCSADMTVTIDQAKEVRFSDITVTLKEQGFFSLKRIRTALKEKPGNLKNLNIRMPSIEYYDPTGVDIILEFIKLVIIMPFFFFLLPLFSMTMEKGLELIDSKDIKKETYRIMPSSKKNLKFLRAKDENPVSSSSFEDSNAYTGDF